MCNKFGRALFILAFKLNNLKPYVIPKSKKVYMSNSRISTHTRKNELFLEALYIRDKRKNGIHWFGYHQKGHKYNSLNISVEKIKRRLLLLVIVKEGGGLCDHEARETLLNFSF